MDIGKEKRTIIVEPLEEPNRATPPAPAPEKTPEPVKVPEKVPA